MLPSEHQLTALYSCARNTVRRAIAGLAAQGYVQSIHGKGVRVIYQPHSPSQFALGHIETFKEALDSNKKTAQTKVVLFTEIITGDALHKTTFFPVGTLLFYVQRVRYLAGQGLIIDHNYFRQDIVAGLTREICEGSVYEYIEHTLGQTIITTKRVVTVEHATPLDKKYLYLQDYNCVAIVSNSTYNNDGIMFEYTQSRHVPSHFVFYDQAYRTKK